MQYLRTFHAVFPEVHAVFPEVHAVFPEVHAVLTQVLGVLSAVHAAILRPPGPFIGLNPPSPS
jgi:hypothetical protein